MPFIARWQSLCLCALEKETHNEMSKTMDKPMEIYIVIFTTIDMLFPDRPKSCCYPFRTLEEAKAFVFNRFWRHYSMITPIVLELIAPFEEEEAVIIGNDFRISWKINKATL